MAVEDEMSELTVAETRWMEYWHGAVNKVKQLY